MHLPPKSGTPILCVGPGTGVAPMRALIEERVAQGAVGMQQSSSPRAIMGAYLVAQRIRFTSGAAQQRWISTTAQSGQHSLTHASSNIALRRRVTDPRASPGHMSNTSWSRTQSGWVSWWLIKGPGCTYPGTLVNGVVEVVVDDTDILWLEKVVEQNAVGSEGCNSKRYTELATKDDR